MLTANKQGYVSASYGARRPNRPGTALVLADDQRITGLTLRMTRGSAISGVLVDQNGEPFSGANVSAMRNRLWVLASVRYFRWVARCRMTGDNTECGDLPPATT